MVHLAVALLVSTRIHQCRSRDWPPQGAKERHLYQPAISYPAVLQVFSIAIYSIDSRRNLSKMPADEEDKPSQQDARVSCGHLMSPAVTWSYRPPVN
ncbi:hypothetical protein RRG08_043949 [Elysia crispata]|uniref:Secreted protein n=1 Tax=Elysia crispata TaxID=231223 RepID=A0AAE0Y195_9GAST|nr:hypothetical protein RRG08_043949 [Elysia crispata]